MIKQKLFTVIILSALVAPQANAANLYKYEDDQGRVITSSRVPAEFVKNGYQVLNERGQVIEEVARILTGEELAAQTEEMAALRQSEEARLQQEEDDMLLLRLYRSPEEVIRRRDSTVEELEGQITVLNSLLEDAEEKLIDIEGRVERNEAAGNDLPANLVSQLADATEERDRLSRQVQRMNSEQEDALVTAQKNIDRLKVLLNLE